MGNNNSPLHTASKLVAIPQGEAISFSRAAQSRSWNSGMSSTLLFTGWHLPPGTRAILPIWSVCKTPVSLWYKHVCQYRTMCFSKMLKDWQDSAIAEKLISKARCRSHLNEICLGIQYKLATWAYPGILFPFSLKSWPLLGCQFLWRGVFMLNEHKWKLNISPE